MSDSAGIISAILGFMVFIWIFAIAIAILIIIATWKVYEKAGEPGWASLIPFYNNYVMYKISWGNGWYFLLSTVPSLISSISYQIWYFSLIGRGLFEYGYGYRGYYGGNYDALMGNMLAESVGLIILMIFLGIFTAVIGIITCVKLAKAFGQGGGFACGLIFLYPVFICIMAFSKDMVYVGIPGKTPPYGGQNSQRPQQPNWQNPYQQPNQAPPQYGPAQGWGWQPPEPQQQSFQTPQTPDADSQAPIQETAKFCPDCGAQMKQEDQFCPRCGRPQ